jgi:glutaredoxin 2
VATAFDKPARVIREQLPTVYVYDHCPFCVRVRVALGIKNVKHNLYFLANDDVPTPTALVGKKIAPIFVSAAQI